MTRILALSAALLVAFAARAEEPAKNVLTKAPAVIEPAEPVYPEEAKAAGLSAEVTLEVEISATGEVVSATVTQPAGHGFDEAALAAAKKLRFSPAEIDGQPAAVRIEYRYNFALQTPVAAPPTSEAVNLRGQVFERGTHRPLAAASVEAGGKTTTTGKDGRFELAGVPLGKVKVTVFDPGYQKYEVEETVEAGQVTEVKYWIERSASGPYEAVVVGERDRREVSRVAISAGEISKIPGASGDAVKVILNLPGVARNAFGIGPLVIRGGNARDTRVYVDDIEVPLIFHFGGITSIYSSDLLKEVEFEPGNFGVKSGRATGGRINLVTRDPGDQTHLVGDVNLYQGMALAETRLSDNLGIAVSARRSWADVIINAVAKNQDSGTSFSVAPRYYDFQAKLTWTPTPADKLRLDVFGSDDKMVLTGVKTDSLVNLGQIGFETFFTQIAASWEHRFDPATRAHVTLGQGWITDDTSVGDIYTEHDRFVTTSLRAEISHEFGSTLRLAAGFDGLFRPGLHAEILAPANTSSGQLEGPIQSNEQRLSITIDETQAAGWIEATLKPVAGLTLVPGIRADTFRSISNLSWVDPRVAARFELSPNTTVKAAVGLYHQPPPYVFLTREWGNPDLEPEASWQYSAGLEQKLLGRLFLDAQLYYKRLFNLAAATDATTTRDGQTVPVRFASNGAGKAYGAELLLRYEPDGRFFGWIAYSLSKATRDYHNTGSMQRESGSYDQPHHLVAVGTWELPEIWTGFSAGFRVQYTSGSPYERIQSAVYDADRDAYQANRTGQFNARMPPFFQADIRIDKKWNFRTWNFSTYLELQNVTNRKNAEFVSYNYDYSKSGFVSGIPLFPAFGLRAEY